MNQGGGEVLREMSAGIRPGNVRDHGSGLFRSISTSLGSEADLQGAWWVGVAIASYYYNREIGVGGEGCLYWTHLSHLSLSLSPTPLDCLKSILILATGM